MNAEKRVAVVTGANRGIGFEVCRELAQNDIDVILKSLICFFTLMCFLGCQRSLVPDEQAGYAGNSSIRICGQRDSEQAQSPRNFKITPVQAIERSKPYFIENPFELVVYADMKNYYVDISTFGANAQRVGDRGVVVDGKTGEIIRGTLRIIGK